MTYAVISSLLGDVQPSFSARLLKTRQLLKLELNFCREVENVLFFFLFFFSWEEKQGLRLSADDTDTWLQILVL